MSRRLFVIGVLIVQIICACLFLVNILSSITGLARLNWMVHELIELGAGLGLIMGVMTAVFLLRRTLKDNAKMEGQLRAASGAFLELLDEKFTHWSLTPAERDVALFALKGFSTQEIATLRDVSEGTVKAQTNAIYRKAGVTGRPQLMSVFIEDLMDGPMIKSSPPAQIPEYEAVMTAKTVKADIEVGQVGR